ncbi:helix-turn-helix domain-containing protein [Paenibacillus sepulcri]|uniref:Helix-turn-helix domain-containing protein n=1 Tax=Paenibacillus sepulcri TaxID=359917 RepID=A0ABS7C3X9_9BACL|nr:helix-turn-helix domain-containing protein [Paenibacillus sepulcri]
MNDKPGSASFHPRSLPVVKEAKVKIERTIMYMQDHLGENISREQLAAHVGLNPEHYSRMFRKYTGSSPVDYMTELRMEQAKKMLLRSTMSIREIARQVGYGDPYYFSRRFKKMAGIAPSDYMKSPQRRIVTLDYYGHCRALGIEPVGADVRDVSGYFPDWTARTQHVGRADEPFFETAQIAALKPDMILTSRKEFLEQLSDLAPTVVVGMNQDPIHEQFVLIAGCLGKEKEALDWVSAYEEQAALLREKVAAAVCGGTVAVLRVRDGLLQMYGVMNMGYPLYRSLQLKPPAKIQWQMECNAYFHSSVIELEELRFYSADHVFVVLQPDAGAKRMWDKVRSSPAWNAFPAARSGHIYHLDVRCWLAFDPVSIQMQMNEAAALLLGH